MELTKYWAWYRQRLWRCLAMRTLLSATYVKRVDSMVSFYDRLGPYGSLMWSSSTCVIDPEFITHLPHHVQGVWPQGVDDQGVSIKCPAHDSMQESWCAQHVGMRDRDWLYLGKGCWAFRQPEDATHLQLVWS